MLKLCNSFFRFMIIVSVTLLMGIFFLPSSAMAIDFNENVNINDGNRLTINNKECKASEPSRFPEKKPEFCYPTQLTFEANESEGIINSYAAPLSLSSDKGITLESNKGITLESNKGITLESNKGVGIGTKNPEQKLHVVGNRIRLENDSKILDFRADGAAVDIHSLTNDLLIHSGGSNGKNRVLINPFDGEGSVGIGITDPCPSVSLQVFGKSGSNKPSSCKNENEAIQGIGPGGGVKGISISKSSEPGVEGRSIESDTGIGVRGQGSGIGVIGMSSAARGIGVKGEHNLDLSKCSYEEKLVSDPACGYAGLFEGNVRIQGSLAVDNLIKQGGYFRIDHPLDPANKYLNHAFVESPDMMTIYNGITMLDGDGKISVKMPDYFESLNREFRYNLTPIGSSMPALYISREISDNRFEIAGGAPGMKVSWQVTGVRKDPWAEAHRISAEEDKSRSERGFYLHPELYGQSEDKSLFRTIRSDLERIYNTRR